MLTGQNDALFCGNGSRVLGTPDCGSGATSQLAALKVFYPAVPASKFDYYAQPSSGHSLQQHYTAASGFAKVSRSIIIVSILCAPLLMYLKPGLVSLDPTNISSRVIYQQLYSLP